MRKISLLVLAGLIYFISKKMIYALGISIIISNLLLSSGYLKTLENFEEGNTNKKVAENKAIAEALAYEAMSKKN